MNKKLIIIIAVILILAGFLFYYFFNNRSDIGPSEALITIDFGETKRSFAGEAIEGMTVLDVLITSARTGDFDFDFDFEKGVLKRVDIFQQNGKKWNFYFNDKKTEESLDDVFIKPGDKIKLKFE